MTRPWFTSDTHFFHNKMAAVRGFAVTADMNAAMSNNWNKRVRIFDTVFHLGDLSFAGFSKTQQVVGMLNGHLKIVPGNHDDVSLLKRLHTASGPVEVLPPLKTYKHTVPKSDGTSDVLRFVLCHFPLGSWDKMHYGAMHLHGHSHGFYTARGKMLDVGVDTHLGYKAGYAPISLDEVMEYMAGRDFVQVDQHVKDHE